MGLAADNDMFPLEGAEQIARGRRLCSFVKKKVEHLI